MTREKTTTKYIETPVKTIFKKFAASKDVTLVYGEPIELGLKKVIPVAKVKYAFGGGGDGKGGEGGGGAFSIKPLGVYEILPERVSFIGITDRKKVTLAAIVTAGIVMSLALSRRKKK